MTRQLVLELDELDWQTIHKYIADYQSRSAKILAVDGKIGPTILPDGDSNLAGAIMAECVRDLIKYRHLKHRNRL